MKVFISLWSYRKSWWVTPCSIHFSNLIKSLSSFSKVIAMNAPPKIVPTISLSLSSNALQNIWRSESLLIPQLHTLFRYFVSLSQVALIDSLANCWKMLILFLSFKFFNSGEYFSMKVSYNYLKLKTELYGSSDNHTIVSPVSDNGIMPNSLMSKFMSGFFTLLWKTNTMLFRWAYGPSNGKSKNYLILFIIWIKSLEMVNFASGDNGGNTTTLWSLQYYDQPIVVLDIKSSYLPR